MADNTHIEWADSTFNPWEGCQKVGPGCDHCYAETRNARFGGGEAPNWGPGAPRRRTSASNWNKPRKWQREAAAFFAEHGRRRRVFCASLADVFDNAVPAEWREDLFTLIAETPDLDWLLLTKRIGNVAGMLPADWGAGWPHVWLGATVVNQAEADRDIPKLLETPAAVRFVSCEPLLGAVDLTRLCVLPRVPGSVRAGIHIDALAGRYRESGMPNHGHSFPANEPLPSDARGPRLDWVIAGGESGPGARPMHSDWVRFLRDQCAAADVPFFFKQWGEWLSCCQFDLAIEIDDDPEHSWFWHREYDDGAWSDPFKPMWMYWEDVSTHNVVIRVGKKAAGRTLDGAEHLAWPESPAGRAAS